LSAPAACRFDGDHARGAPRVLAVPTPTGGGPEAERTAARQLARQALAGALAQALGCAPHDIAITGQRGTPPRAHAAPGAAAPALAARLGAIGLSISHARGLSLVAWHAGGPVGVDLQRVDEASFGPAPERARLAALYLGPDFESNSPPALAGQAQAATDLIVFAARWTAHEAALKCLGEPLREWSPALQARLARCPARPLAVPGAAHWAAAVAYAAAR
jgi:4'-phosphopantetheinyl transferase